MRNRSIVLRQAFRAGGVALAIAGGLGLIGCTAAYVTDSQAPVLFIVTDVNKGEPLQSDVEKAGTVADDTVQVLVANRPKNPNFSNLPQVAMAILVERYEVSYYRSDGRGVQGVDVPFSISGNITTTVDVSNSANSTLTLSVVRAQAKLEPPLYNLWLGGQEIKVSMFAKITIHGRTVAGQAVEASGTLQIEFSDFPD